MRLFSAFLLLFFSASLLAQPTKRFYPSVSQIFLTQDAEALPKECAFLTNWLRQTTDRFFYADLQHNGDPKNSASFNSLSLIIKGEHSFDFFDTGLNIEFNRDVKEKESKVSLLNNNQWKIKAYPFQFSFESFSPQHVGLLYLYGLVVNNISDKEALAHYVNTFEYPRKKDNSGDILGQFIKTLNRENEMDIDPGTDLNNLCDSIKVRFPNAACTSPAYKAFIEDEDPAVTRANINKFFFQFEISNIEDVLNKYLLPDGNMQFINQNVHISLPQKHFKGKGAEKKEAVRFSLSNIMYDLRYDYEAASYYFVIKLIPFKGTLSHDMQFKHLQYDVVKDKAKATSILVPKAAFEYLEVILYPKKYKLTIHAQEDVTKLAYPTAYALYKPIKFSVKK